MNILIYEYIHMLIYQKAPQTVPKGCPTGVRASRTSQVQESSLKMRPKGSQRVPKWCHKEAKNRFKNDPLFVFPCKQVHNPPSILTRFLLIGSC